MPSDFFIPVAFVWLLVVTFFLVRVFLYFRHLSKEVNKGNLINVLEKVMVQEEVNKKDIAEVNKKILWLEDEGQLHIKKIGLVRFNPFKELGGDHSFSLALLDGKDTGVIITGLHTRERTRVYVKEITRGKSRLELSNEEKKALKLAQKK